MAIVLALLLISLHGPGGQLLIINPLEISSLRSPLESNSHFARGTHCIVVMSNGRVNATLEDCLTVQRQIMGTR